MRLPEPKAKRKNNLEGQMLQRGLFSEGFKWNLCQLVQHQGEVPGGDNSVPIETIQEMSEIFIFSEINGGVA